MTARRVGSREEGSETKTKCDNAGCRNELEPGGGEQPVLSSSVCNANANANIPLRAKAHYLFHHHVDPLISRTLSRTNGDTYVSAHIPKKASNTKGPHHSEFITTQYLFSLKGHHHSEISRQIR